MKFLKQKEKLPIINFDYIINKHSKVKKKMKPEKINGNLLPNTLRSIVCGPSNCGKTNLIISLLFSPNGLFFKNVYIYSKSLYQPKYKFLSCILKDIPEIGYFKYNDNETVPPPENVRPHSVMIFDDVSCEKQEHMRSYFSRGRHNLLDSFYLCQTYSSIPKQLVRDNANFIILFKQDNRNLQHIYHDHVNTDMTFDQFKNMCAVVWKKNRNSFVIIDKDRELNKGRYRGGFDCFISFK